MPGTFSQDLDTGCSHSEAKALRNFAVVLPDSTSTKKLVSTRKHLGKVPFWKKGTFFHPSRELLCWRKNPVWRPEACFWHACTNVCCAAILNLADSCHDSCCSVDAHATADILGAAANFLAATVASYARFYHSVFTSRWFARFWRQGRMAALAWIAVWTLSICPLEWPVAGGWFSRGMCLGLRFKAGSTMEICVSNRLTTHLIPRYLCGPYCWIV